MGGHMEYAFKTYKKIDLYTRRKNGNWVYETSTTAYKTCKQAKIGFCKRYCLDETQVQAKYA